jgi:hypothetical protein
MVLLCALVWLVEQSPAVHPPEPNPELPEENFLTEKRLKNLFTCAGLMIFQQATGITFFYTDLAGASPSRVLSVYSSITQVVACAFGAVLIEKIGRRTVLVSSQSIVTVVNFADALFLLTVDRGQSDGPDRRDVAFIIVPTPRHDKNDTLAHVYF